MLKYFLWYWVTGFVLVTVYGIGIYIGLVMKYGLDIASRAAKLVNEEDVYCGRTLFEKIANVIIGTIVWPARLSEAPALAETLHERCEELLKSKESAT